VVVGGLVRRCLALGLVLACLGCAGRDVASSDRPDDSAATRLGDFSWYLPSSVTTQTVAPTHTSTPDGDGAIDVSEMADWTLKGTGTWDGSQVKVFGRAMTVERSAGDSIDYLVVLGQTGAVPSWRSLRRDTVTVQGADEAETLVFSYDGSDGSGQGMWLAARSSRADKGVVVQVALPGGTIDPAFVDKVADSLELTTR
jgi:hypothetical protein